MTSKVAAKKTAAAPLSARAAVSGVSAKAFAARSHAKVASKAAAARVATVFAADKPDRSNADAPDAGKGQKLSLIHI